MPFNVTLASSLLDLEVDQHRNAIEAGGRTFRTGIEVLDRDLPDSIWRGGDVVGIGSDPSEGLSSKTDSLPLEIIVTHLLEGHANPPQDSVSNTNPNDTIPSVFIVAPPTQATTSIQQTYTKLNARLLRDQQRRKQGPSTTTKPPSNPSQASSTSIDTQTKSLLTHLSLLQYLDISGLTESISEVLTLLTQRQKQRRTILLLQGLPQTLTTTHRRTGTLQTAALLTSLLQSLRNIAHVSGGTCLVLLEIDVAWGGGVSNTNTHTTSNPVPSPNSISPGTALPALKTAFSSRTGKTLRIVSGAVFGRVLEEGVDVLVVLHDGEGRIGRGKGMRVVECVRDERGLGYGDDGEENAIGSWIVWG